MSDFIYRTGLRFGQGACVFRKGVFFKEKADLVAGSEEIIVADVGGAFTRGEFGHGMVGEGEGSEHVVGFCQEGRYG